MPAPEPRLEGRYALTAEGPTVHLWCQDHPESPLRSMDGPVQDFGLELGEVVRTHDREQHEGDPVV